MKSEDNPNWPFVINLGNSIIGVSILAMPFCFKQCGIILGMLVLLFCTWLTLASCQLLVKAGVVSHRRSYEFLAYHTYGAPGKFVVEVSMIGMQIGTLIAQIVVIGDLGPDIMNSFFGVEKTANTRLYLMLTLCLGVGLPLGLMKDMRSVSRVSTICVMFYSTFILYILFMSGKSLLAGTWYAHVNFWRSEGFFQCLPILSFSFGCQTQLFILYEALPEPSLHAIKSIINSAVNLCAVAYLMVGFFGYITFYEGNIPGDVMTLFPSTFGANIMKLGFVLSIAITFPVIIFPCRASIYTLIFQKKMKHGDDMVGQYIPENIFKAITVSIVLVSTITGILIPNVEFILGLNGAITGTLICYIFPALFFLQVMSSKAEGKAIAQTVLVLGVIILVVSTFTTLNAQDRIQVDQKAKGRGDHPNQFLDAGAGKLDVEHNLHGGLNEAIKLGDDKIGDEKRIEPPIPRAPVQNPQEDPGKRDPGNKILEERKAPKPPDKPDVDDEDRERLLPAEAAQELAGKGAGGKEAQDQKIEDNKRQQELLAALEAQRVEQERLLNEQKAVLKELQEHKKEHGINGMGGQIGDNQNPDQPVQEQANQNPMPRQVVLPDDGNLQAKPKVAQSQEQQPLLAEAKIPTPAPQQQQQDQLKQQQQQQQQPVQNVGDNHNILQAQVQAQPQVKDLPPQQPVTPQGPVQQPQGQVQQPQGQVQQLAQQVIPQAGLAPQPANVLQPDPNPIIVNDNKNDPVRSKREAAGEAVDEKQKRENVKENIAIDVKMAQLVPAGNAGEKDVSNKPETQKEGDKKEAVPTSALNADNQVDKHEMRRKLKETGHEHHLADGGLDILDVNKFVQGIVNQGIAIRTLKEHRD